MGIELERLNAEHAIESREDGQELVRPKVHKTACDKSI